MLRPLLVIVMIGLLSPAQAQDKANLDDLLKRSPFGQLDANPKNGPTDNALELRGVMEDGNEVWFSIYESSTKHSTWLSKSDTDQAYAIRDYDAKTGNLTVNYQGRSLTLTLKQAKIQALPAGLVQNDMPPPAPGINAPATPNPSETQRLAAIAEEIRRRRALRQNQAGAPPPDQPGQVKPQ